MSSLHGFLIFQNPNPYARMVPCGGRPLYFLDLQFGLGFVTDQEKMCVGTRCGTIPFSMARVSDYHDYKRGLITEPELMSKYNLPQVSGAIYSLWFGDSLIRVM